MRRAKQGDYWRAIDQSHNWGLRIDNIEFDNIRGIGSGTVQLHSAINMLCGPNGAGKTTLLRAVGAALDPSQIKDSAVARFRLGNGRIRIHLRLNDVAATIERDFSTISDSENPIDGVEIFHVDTSSVVSALQSYFCNYPDIDDALNGAPMLEANQESLDVLSYLTNIRYTNARVYTLEESNLRGGQDNDFAAERPFFEVSVGGAAYDSRTMGLGELAAFYLWWSLERISDRSVLLIEEPESFLSPMCQTAFVAILAKYTATKKPFVIVTTHSPQIIQAAPKSSLLFVYRDAANARVCEGDRLETLLRTVGIEAKTRTLVMIEDNAARVFSKLWIAHFSPGTLAGIEFLVMGGEGKIAAALKAFPDSPKALALVGLLDGDAEAKGYASTRVTFLPGGMPIEAIYRGMLEGELDRVEPILAIQNLRQALFAQQGMELHEWFEALKFNSNLTTDQIHLLLFKAWIQKPENHSLAAQYFGALQSMLEKPIEK